MNGSFTDICPFSMSPCDAILLGFDSVDSIYILMNILTVKLN